MPGWAHYVQPFLRLPARWSGVDEVAQPTTGEELKTDLAQWWRSFNDPLLNELIAQALSSNLRRKDRGEPHRTSQSS
jgi:outer membrane protein TolC